MNEQQHLSWKNIKMEEDLPGDLECMGNICDLLGDSFVDENDINYRLWAWKDKVGNVILTFDAGNTHLKVIARIQSSGIVYFDEEVHPSITLVMEKLKAEHYYEDPSTKETLKVISLFATADQEGNYLDISTERSDCERWLTENKEAVRIVDGFGVAHSKTNEMHVDAVDFHYSIVEARAELVTLSNKL